MAPIDLTVLYKQGVAAQQAGQTDAALAIYDRILAIKPDVAEVLFQKARCLAEPADAARTFRAALKLKPKEAAIWQGLHGVLRGPARVKLEKDAQRARIVLGSEADARPIKDALKAGRADVAEARAVALSKKAPLAFWPLYLLGEARLALSKPAVSPLEAALKRDPDHAPARLAMARAYAAAGRPVQAEATLDGLTSPAADLIRARIWRDTARPEDAVALWQSRPPKGVRGAVELTLALAQCGQGAAALKAAERAIKTGAAREGLLRLTATALEEAGDVAGAEAAIDHALAQPTPALLTHRAQLHQSAGNFPAADAALMAALDVDAEAGEVFRAYMNARKITPDDPVLPRLEAALTRPDLKANSRARLHFAAAKARGDLGDHDTAATHLEVANRLTAKAFPYGFDADLAQARLLVSEQARLDAVDATGPTDRVVFVTGLPRSGTTLVETILAAHPDVRAGGEMPFLGRALGPVLEELRYGTLSQDTLATAGARYLAAARRRTGPAPIIVDKAIATFSRIGHAARALPGAQFVLVKRDPRDVGLSLYRNMFSDGLHRYAYNLQGMGRYIRLHDALVDFWQKALPDRVHVVEYEALTAAPEPQIRTLLQAVGLPWDDACLTPETTQRRIQTLSFAQARQPIGTDAVAGWTRYADMLGPLIGALEADVDIMGQGEQ